MTQTPDQPTPRHPYDHTDDEPNERPVEDIQTGEYL